MLKYVGGRKLGISEGEVSKRLLALFIEVLSRVRSCSQYNPFEVFVEIAVVDQEYY
jgi:hypothetical protein